MYFYKLAIDLRDRLAPTKTKGETAMQKLITVLGAIMLISTLSACSESTSVSVSGSGAKNISTVSTEDGKVTLTTRVELPKETATEVRIWLCSNGKMSFDNEKCRPDKNENIQQKITERFPNYSILKIERTKEDRSEGLGTFRNQTVYYITLILNQNSS